MQADDGFAMQWTSETPRGLPGRDQADVASPAEAEAKQLQTIDKASQNFGWVFIFEGQAKEAGRAVEIAPPEMMLGMRG